LIPGPSCSVRRRFDLKNLITPYKPAIIEKLADGTNPLIGYDQAVSSENIPGPEQAKKKQRT
jgi:hypothetical protein